MTTSRSALAIALAAVSLGAGATAAGPANAATASTGTAASRTAASMNVSTGWSGYRRCWIRNGHRYCRWYASAARG